MLQVKVRMNFRRHLICQIHKTKYTSVSYSAKLLLHEVQFRYLYSIKHWPNGLASQRKFAKPELAYGLAKGGQTDSQVGLQVAKSRKFHAYHSEMALDFFNLGPGTHISGPVGVPNDFYGSQNLSLVPEIICKLKIIFNYPFRQNRTRRGQKIITILGLV